MKQNLLFALLTFFSGTAFSQATDTAVLDLYIDGGWVHNTRNISTYDGACSLASVQSQVWDAGAQEWVNQFLTTYTPVSVITKSWDSGTQAWVNFTKTTKSYSDDGLKLATIGENWDAGSLVWVSNYRILTAFNAAGFGTAEEINLFINNQWEKITKTSIDYDLKNRPLVIVSRVWMNNQWTNSSRRVISYSYSTKGESIGYYWSDFEQRWIKSDRSYNEYIPGTSFSLKSLGQSYLGETWQNNSRQANEYSPELKFEASKLEIWDAGLSAWVKIVRTNQQYFSNGQPSENLVQTWDNGTGTWVNNVRYTQTGYNCPVEVMMLQVAPNGKTDMPVIRKGRMMEAFRGQQQAINMFCFNPAQSSNEEMVFDVNIPAKGSTGAYNFKLIHAFTPQKAIAAVPSTAEEIKQSKQLFAVIGPNPARHYVNINVNSSNAVVSIHDMSGRLVLQQKLQQGLQKINLPAMQKGIYMVTITGGREIIREKLFIE